jgi:hypothetical protein
MQCKSTNVLRENVETTMGSFTVQNNYLEKRPIQCKKCVISLIPLASYDVRLVCSNSRELQFNNIGIISLALFSDEAGLEVRHE